MRILKPSLALCLLGGLVLLAAPLLLSRAVEHPAASSAAAGDTLVIICPHNQDIRNEFAWAFSDWHQQHYGSPVLLDYRNPGGTNDIKRQLDTIYREIRSRNGGQLPPEDQIDSGIDIAWGGGDNFFDHDLKPLGVLRPLDIDPRLLAAAFPQPTLGGVKLYDQSTDSAGHPLPPTWVGVCLSSFGIVYNPDLYHSMNLPDPTTWSDLANPQLFGSVALADPTHSGSAAVAYMMVLQRAMANAESAYFDLPDNRGQPHDALKKTPGYEQALDAGWKVGMSQLTLIAANSRYFSDSANQVPTDVAAGDAAAGVAIDFYGHVTEEIVGPDRERFVLPAAATAITPDPIAILYGTHGRKLELAHHFIEFLLSPEGQRLWILKVGQPGGPRVRALRRPPIRRDVYADRTGWADDVDYFTAAGGFNQRGEWMGMLTDVRMIWAAAWIDARDDLRSAAAAVLAIPDPARRANLLAELADPPMTRSDLTELGRQRKIAATSSDPDRWQAETREQWAMRFRKQYEKVIEEAK